MNLRLTPCGYKDFKDLQERLLILLQFASPVHAQQFDQWVVGPLKNNIGVFTATTNDSSGILRQYCYSSDGNCYWLMMTNIECTDENRYPILVNAESGATNTELVCTKIDGKARYAFTSFDTIDSIIRKSSNIGFAFPMENGRFQVSRFNLNGAVKALTHMRAIAEKILDLKESKTTRDLRL